MDVDFALALSLQFEDENKSPTNPSTSKVWSSSGDGLNRNVGHNGLSSASSFASRPLSIVDESWELIDPVPNIHDLFLQFNDAYFDGKLAGVEVKWSPKMTLCAGVCSYEGRGGLCSIRLSQPLLKLRPRKDLVQTLLHEMIHALLFVTQNNKDHDSHGPEFHKHMFRINKQSGANITVYHNFHDEVNNYRQHWWKCDGQCKSRPPFYGIVRRAMNRAPSKNDTWWSEHLRTCGGTFHKIKEPEDYGKKSSKRKHDENRKEPSLNAENTSLSKGQDISKWFKPVQSNEKTVIKTINDCSSDDKKSDTPCSIFSGNGQSLFSSDNKAAIISKDEWIKRLIQKQEHTSKGKLSMKALNKNELIPDKRQKQLKVTSTVTSRANGIGPMKSDLNKSHTKSVTFGNTNRTIGKTENSGFPTRLKSIEPAFEILSSTLSSASSPSALSSSISSPLPSSSINDLEMTANSQNSGNRVSTAIVIDDSSPTEQTIEFVDCPVCPKKIPINSINLHLDQCLSRGS